MIISVFTNNSTNWMCFLCKPFFSLTWFHTVNIFSSLFRFVVVVLPRFQSIYAHKLHSAHYKQSFRTCLCFFMWLNFIVRKMCTRKRICARLNIVGGVRENQTMLAASGILMKNKADCRMMFRGRCVNASID